jgi:hypothetical protein
MHDLIILNIMSLRFQGFQAVSLDGDASYEANEPLIVATGDAEQEDEEEVHRLEEKAFSVLNSVLLGLLAGFVMQISMLVARVLVIALSGEDLATKTKTEFVVFGLLWSFFTAIFLCTLVTITYSCVRGRSNKELLEASVLHICFSMGVCLSWTMTGAFWGMWTQTGYALAGIVVALVWCKIVMFAAADADSKPSSSHQSTAKQVMTADV